MLPSHEHPSFESALPCSIEIRQLRQAVDNLTNLFYVAMEYSCLVAVIGSAITFAQFSATWGLM